VDVWVRRCASFEEEQRADREFWRAMTPAARIEALEELRELWRTSTGDTHEGLRRTVRVLQPPGR
jgi:hypothetical protein